MKLELVTVTSKIFLHIGRGCKPARWGWGKLRMARWRTTSVDLPCTVQLQEYVDGTFTNGSVAMEREQCFHRRKSDDVSGMKNASLWIVL